MSCSRDGDPFKPDKKGRTPMHALCEIITEHDCNIAAGECPRCTVYAQCVEIFLSKHADVQIPEDSGVSSLDILFRGACKETNGSRKPTVNYSCSKAFHKALKSINVAKKVSIRWKTWSALGFAFCFYDSELAETLLHVGADVDEMNDFGWGPINPLQLMINSGCRDEIAEIALSKTRNKYVRDSGGYSLLHEPSVGTGQECSVKILQLLVNSGLNLEDCENTRFLTPLQLAADYGITFLIPKFVQLGADVNRSSKGWTALALDCLNGHYEIVEYLLGQMSQPHCCVRDLHLQSRVTLPYQDMQCCVGLLHLGAISGSLEIVKLLLKRGEIMKETLERSDGPSPVWWASYLGHDDILSLLLESGLDTPTSEQSQGITALHIACGFGRVGAMKILMASGCDPTKTDRLKRSAMDHAVMSGSTEAVKLLTPFVTVCEANGLAPESKAGSTTRLTNTKVLPQFIVPLLQKGDLAILKSLEQDGVNLCAPLSCGYDALMISLLAQQTGVCQYLLSIGAPVDRVICKNLHPPCMFSTSGVELHAGWDCFDVAVRTDNLLLQPLLHQLPNDHTWQTRIYRILQTACSLGKVEIVKRLSRHYLSQGGISIPCLDAAQHRILGTAPLLHISVKSGSRDTCLVLLSFKLAVDDLDANLDTPLAEAVRSGHFDIARVLLDYGANPNSFNSVCFSPMHYAASQLDPSVLKLLLEYGGDPLIRDGPGCSSLCAAAVSGSIKNVILLSSLPEYYLSLEEEWAYEAMIYSSSPAMRTFALNSHLHLKATLGLLRAGLHKRQYPIANAINQLLKKLRSQNLLREMLYEGGTNARPGTEWPGLPDIAMSPLQAACVCGSSNHVQLLLNTGVPLNHESGPRGTPLMYASYYGRMDIVRMLVRGGAILAYTRDNQVFNAIQAAKNFPEIVRWLLVDRFTEQPLLCWNASGSSESGQLDEPYDRRTQTYAPAAQMCYVPWDNREFIAAGEGPAFIARVERRMQAGPFVAREDGWTEIVE